MLDRPLGTYWEGAAMVDGEERGLPLVLPLQELTFDSRVWEPLAERLEQEARFIKVDAPPVQGCLPGPDWTEHVTSWIRSEIGIHSADLVIGEGHAAEDALMITRELESEAVLILRPALNLLIEVDDEDHARILEFLALPETQERLNGVLTAIDPQEIEALPRTGRISEASIRNLIEATLDMAPANPDLTSLTKETAIERMTVSMSSGVATEPVSPNRAARDIADDLGDRLHIALGQESPIDLFGLRDRIAARYPRAHLHDLPGGRSLAWWDHPDAYADLIRSILGSA